MSTRSTPFPPATLLAAAAAIALAGASGTAGRADAAAPSPAAEGHGATTVVVLPAGQAPPAREAQLERLVQARLARGPVALVSSGSPARVLVPPTRSVAAIARGLAAPVATDGSDLVGAATTAASLAARVTPPPGVVLAVSRAGEARAFAAAVRSAQGPGAPAVGVERLSAALRHPPRRADAPLLAATPVASVDGGGMSLLALPFALLVLLAVGLLTFGRRRASRSGSVARRVAAWSDGLVFEPVSGDADDDEPERRTGSSSAALARLQARLDLGGPGLAASTLVIRTVLATVLMSVIGLLIGPWLLPAALVAPSLVARWVVRRRIRRRREAFAGQLGDAVQAIAAAMRAGHGIGSAITMLLDDLPSPMQDELRAVVAAERIGVSFDVAMADAVERTANRDLQQVGLVASLQREAGGNGAEALDRVVETIRARDDVRRLVTTLTAQGRMSRWVLTSLPVGLTLTMMAIGHGYLSPLVETPLGLLISATSVGMVALGSFWIGRIVEIEV